MNIKLEADFETYDHAENCARIIKRHVPDIVALSLKGRDNLHDTKEFTLIPLFGENNFNNTYADRPNAVYNGAFHIETSEHEVKQDAKITVEIDVSQQKSCEKIIRSNGGLNIKELSLL